MIELKIVDEEEVSSTEIQNDMEEFLTDLKDHEEITIDKKLYTSNSYVHKNIELYEKYIEKYKENMK
eukprot:GAHX01002431.1.p1 GENE.GAHX01002431.1~~GAHX01002431.1.p1  ORF type:complete len:67 (+),score=14.77 GAHX01002431.1:62-262(+)